MKDLRFDIELRWWGTGRDAVLAHDRCLIGHTLAPEATYEVSSVRVQEEALAPAGVRTGPPLTPITT